MLVSRPPSVRLKIRRAQSLRASTETSPGRNVFPSIVPSIAGGAGTDGVASAVVTAGLADPPAGAEPSGFLSWQPRASTSERNRSPREHMTNSGSHDDGRRK